MPIYTNVPPYQSWNVGNPYQDQIDKANRMPLLTQPAYSLKTSPVVTDTLPPIMKDNASQQPITSKPDTTNPSSNPMSLTTAANIMTGINTLAGTVANIVGMNRAMKQKPHIMGYVNPITPTLIKDHSNPLVSAGKENISSAVSAERLNRRMMGLNSNAASIIGNESKALNELSAQAEQQRASVEAQNAQIENTMKQFNEQQKMQVEAQNVQILNADAQQKSSIMSQGISGIMQGITAGENSIIGNLNYQRTLKEADRRNSISTIKDILATTTDLIERKKLMGQLAEIQKQPNYLL